MTQGRRVIRWIERHCVHTNGEWIGQRFRLLVWQKRLILALFAVDPATRLRLYRWALIGVPKKNGKTELAAALALYFLVGDEEPAALVVCAAASDGQADLVFGAAKTMCELSPTLRAVTGGESNNGDGERWESEILVPSSPGAKLVRVAAAGGTLDGQNIHAVICDELHEWITDRQVKTWTILTNGAGARRQPMVLQITTAGWDLEDTVCGQQFTHCERVANGEVDDPTYYVFWQQAPDGADWRDPATWLAANPSYGHTVHEQFFRDQMTKKTRATFERYFLNRWTSTEELWEVADFWADLAEPRCDLDPVLPTTVMIDASRKGDSTAVVAAQRQPSAVLWDVPADERRATHHRTVVKAWIWENPFPPSHPRHATWKVPTFEVEHRCRWLHASFPVATREVEGEVRPGPAYFYDERYFNRSADVLEGDGLCMIEFPQTDGRMCPASQLMFELAVNAELVHDGDTALARHIRNVQPDDRSNGWRISKPRNSRKKIDAAIGVAVAASEAQKPVPRDRVFFAVAGV